MTSTSQTNQTRILLQSSLEHWNSLTEVQQIATAELAKRYKAQTCSNLDPCASSPLKWLEIKRPKIFHPINGLIVFEPRPYQRELLNDWDASKRIVLKSRQIGISQTISAEVIWKALYRAPRRILVVSRNLDQAIEFIRYARMFIPADVSLTEDNKTSLTFANGSQIKAQGDSPDAGRGYAASDVYLDEFAFQRWSREIWQAISPTVSTGGSLTVVSTPFGATGKFHDLWKEASAVDSQWKTYRFPWSVHFDDAWAEATRKQLSRAEFASEHDCSFEESGDHIWRHADIDACMETDISCGPLDEHTYMIAADMAGMGKDSTVILVIDTTAKPYRVVHTRKLDKASNQAKIDAFDDLSNMYGVEDLWVDATGQSALDITDEFQKALKETSDAKRTVNTFTFTVKSKSEALTRLTRWIEKRDILYDDHRIREQLLAYKLPDTGLKTDYVMALAIAAHVLELPRIRPRMVVV